MEETPAAQEALRDCAFLPHSKHANLVERKLMMFAQRKVRLVGRLVDHWTAAFGQLRVIQGPDAHGDLHVLGFWLGCHWARWLGKDGPEAEIIRPLGVSPRDKSHDCNMASRTLLEIKHSTARESKNRYNHKISFVADSI